MPALLKAVARAGTVAFAADRRDAAGLEEILGKTRARGELRRRAKIGEEDFRPRPGFGQRLVGSLAQLFERLGKAKPRQRFGGYVASFFGRRFDRRDVKNRRQSFMQIRIGIGAGQHVLAARDGFLPFGAHRGDTFLDRAGLQRRPRAAGFFDVLED